MGVCCFYIVQDIPNFDAKVITSSYEVTTVLGDGRVWGEDVSHTFCVRLEALEDAVGLENVCGNFAVAVPAGKHHDVFEQTRTCDLTLVIVVVVARGRGATVASTAASTVAAMVVVIVQATEPCSERACCRRPDDLCLPEGVYRIGVHCNLVFVRPLCHCREVILKYVGVAFVPHKHR